MKFPNNDSTRAFLIANSYTATGYNDGLKQHLTFLGYTGSLTDQMAQATEADRLAVDAGIALGSFITLLQGGYLVQVNGSKLNINGV